MIEPEKPPISLIVAMASNRVIGVENDLPWHIPADLQHFRSLTSEKPVFMGRKTFQSIVERIGRPLPGRPNYVISTSFSYPGVDVFPDLETAVAEAGYEHPNKELMIIGGASIYEQAIALVDRMYLTVIHRDYRGDAKFPEYDKADWLETTRDTREGDPAFSFITLDRKKT
jgi:dihydrofolate reductase